MRFRAWLKNQEERDDAVGDLATDYNRALEMEQRAPFKSSFNEEYPRNSWDVERLMEKYNAHPDALEALEKAIAEYNVGRPGTPYPMSREDNKEEK